jgi:hypothetical protein
MGRQKKKNARFYFDLLYNSGTQLQIGLEGGE